MPSPGSVSGLLSQTNVEMYPDAINKKHGADHQIPVVFYSQLLALVFGMDGKKDAALDQNTIKSAKLEELAKIIMERQWSR